MRCRRGCRKFCRCIGLCCIVASEGRQSCGQAMQEETRLSVDMICLGRLYFCSPSLAAACIYVCALCPVCRIVCIAVTFVITMQHSICKSRLQNIKATTAAIQLPADARTLPAMQWGS